MKLRARSGWVLVALVAAHLPRCSQVVAQDIREVRCAAEGQIGPPACNPGEFCALARCSVCLPDEVCGDQLDNDCNESVDDTCESQSTTDGDFRGNGGSNGFDESTPWNSRGAGGDAGSSASGRRPFSGT